MSSFPAPLDAWHGLERMKVLDPRFPFKFLSQWRHKEWWYTGVYDAATGVYVSWYFVRASLVDQLTVTVFDPSLAEGDLPRLSGRCLLREESPVEGLCLAARGRGFTASYRWSADDAGPGQGAWRFALASSRLGADLRIEPDSNMRPFTKFDDDVVDDHTAIVHTFHNRATGEVRVPGAKTYAFSSALCYLDHCYGRVPSRTAWHWIAVQSERIALTVLVNYGPSAQRYAQVWLVAQAGAGPRTGEWVRLDQSVSFEHEDRPAVSGRWRVTSTDLELTLDTKRLCTDRTKIPPVLGLFVDLAHTEALVEVSGRVRIDGAWLDTGVLHGVLEQHGGRW